MRASLLGRIGRCTALMLLALFGGCATGGLTFEGGVEDYDAWPEYGAVAAGFPYDMDYYEPFGYEYGGWEPGYFVAPPPVAAYPYPPPYAPYGSTAGPHPARPPHPLPTIPTTPHGRQGAPRL